MLISEKNFFEQLDTFRTLIAQLSTELAYESEAPQIPDYRQTRFLRRENLS
jgi:hypothetical protein